MLNVFQTGSLDFLNLSNSNPKLKPNLVLGTATGQMALQFLDSLTQARILGLAAKHHRFQRVQKLCLQPALTGVSGSPTLTT